MSRRALSMLVVVLGLSGGVPECGFGQELAARGPRFLAAWVPAGQVVDASNVAPLRRRVSLDLTEVKASVALNAIVTAAHLEIAFNPVLLPVERTVSLHARDITVAAALTEVLLGTGLDVTVSRNGSLALTKRGAETARSVSDSGDIVGTVKDQATGAPIVGATVTVEGTDLSTTTDAEGRYRITGVSAGNHTVKVRFIGYAPTGSTAEVVGGQEVAVDVGLVKSAHRLDELVTTGTVIPTEVKGLPNPVSVITADDIARMRPRNLNEIFRQVVPTALAWQGPTDSPHGTAFSVRGASSLVSTVAQMKVFVDGVEAAVRSSGGIDLSNVDRIEILRGPQAAAIYGSDAIGGVIQIFTKRGLPGSHPRVSLEGNVGAIQTPYSGYGTVVRHGYTGAISGGDRQNATYRLGARYSHTGAYTVPDGQQSDYGVNASAELGTGNVTAHLLGDYSIHNTPTLFNPDLFNAGFYYYSKPYHYAGQEQHQTVGSRFTFTPTPWWKHSVTVGLDRLGADVEATEPRLVTPADTLLSLSNTSDAKTSVGYNTSLYGSLSPTVKGTVTLGFDHYDLRSTSFYNFEGVETTNPLVLAPGQTIAAAAGVVRNTGYFVQVQAALHDALFVTAGLRAERNTNFGDSLGTPLLPRFGLAYALPLGQTTLKLRSSWGRAIKPPSPGLKRGASDGFTVLLASPLLGPERQEGWDAGIDAVFGRRFTFAATYYRQTADNLIQLVTLEAAPVLISQYQNIGRVRNSGIELEGGFTATGVQVRIQYGYSRSRVARLSPDYLGDLRIGDQIFALPEHKAAASAAVDLTPGTTLAGGLTFIGKMNQYDFLAYFRCIGNTGPCLSENFAFDRNYLISYPGFVKLNATVSQQLTPLMTAFINIDNLGNRTAPEEVNALAGMGRTTTVGLRLQN